MSVAPDNNSPGQAGRRSGTQLPGSQSVQAVISHGRVPGRLRLKPGGLYRNPALARQLEDRIGKLSWVRQVKATPLTGSLMILYNAAIRRDEILARLAAIDICIEMPARPARESGRNELPMQRKKAQSSAVGFLKKRQLRAVSRQRHHWHALTEAECVDRIGSDGARGLSSTAARQKLRESGYNSLPVAAARPRWQLFQEQFVTLPVAMLGFSAVASLATGGILDAAVIAAVVLINASIGMMTESQSEKTIRSLETYTPRRCRLVRDGSIVEVPVREVVPGDLILLTPGSYVAADVRLIDSHFLSIDESTLTGESVAVAKESGFIAAPATPLPDRKNMAFMGTMVSAGNGSGIVVATGADTEIGLIQSLVGETPAPRTPMEIELDRIGSRLVLLSGAVCACVFLIGLARGKSLGNMLKTSISLAVAAVPEGLPTVATTTLALGIRNMRRQNVSIRHLNAIESLGSLQLICLDKTGTLTMNRMAVISIHAANQDIALGDGDFQSNGKSIQPRQLAELRRLLEVVALCSEAGLEPAGQVQDSPGLNGSPTENALLAASLDAGINVRALRHDYPLIRMHHRTDQRQFMMSVHKAQDAKFLVAVKGSPLELLERCRFYSWHGQALSLNAEQIARLQAANEAMAANALRVLGVAYAFVDDPEQALHSELIWLGMAGMADPIRPGTPQLIEQFHQAGIATVMITGDQSATAYAIGKQLKLSGDRPIEIMDSTHLEKLDPELLASLAPGIDIFARVSPAHKLQIVRALQHSGKVVAMTGDGVNDGPALKAADIGIAMGASGTDVARSLADVILEDDRLESMLLAVEQGRAIFGNIRKALHYLLATNLSEIELTMMLEAFGHEQQLMPSELLWINLVTDIFPALAQALERPEAGLMTRPPRDSDESILRGRDFRRLTRESLLIAGGALASNLYGDLRYGPGPHTGSLAFSTLIIGQILHALSSRSESHSIFSPEPLPANYYLEAAIFGALAAQGLAMASPAMRKLFGTTPLGLLDMAVVAANAVSPLLLNESFKHLGNRRAGKGPLRQLRHARGDRP